MTEARVTELMQEVQREVEKSIHHGNPPFACVITDQNGVIVVRAHNTCNTDNDITAHAEIKALRMLGKRLGTRYCPGYVLFGNAASCPMCMTAAIKAKITQFYYGAPSEGGMDPSLTMEEIAATAKNQLSITGGILAKECQAQIIRGRELELRNVPIHS